MGWTKVIAPLAVIVFVAAALSGCGGGGGGGGGGTVGGGSSLGLLSSPSFGTLRAGLPTTTAFNMLLPNPAFASSVGPNDFSLGLPGDQHYLEFNFSRDLLATSILNPVPNGTNGITIQDPSGINVNFFLDATGALDPTNTFPSPGVAPQLLRLYINEPTFADAARFNGGSYTVNIITQNLKGANGEAFCLVSNGCVNNVEVKFPFSTGGDLNPLGQSVAAFSSPLNGSVVSTNAEYRFFFDDAIDLQSIAGVNNLTSIDQFVTVPYPVNNFDGAATSASENIIVTYNPPAGTVLPANYGFILYQPDPFHDPSEVRLRFVDVSTLASNEFGTNVQNYGIPGAVWTAAGQTAPTNALGQALNLPPLLPLPGSFVAATATLSINFLSAASGFPASDSSAASANPDGVLGCTDRSRNAMLADLAINLTLPLGPGTGNGVGIANNPSPPDLTFAVSNNRLVPISSGKLTLGSLPVAAGGTVTGILHGPGEPNSPLQILDDSTVLASILDVEFGRFINTTSGTNFLHNPPRRLATPGPTDNNGDGAIPFPQGGLPENNLMNILNAPFPPPVPSLGVYIYVVDDIDNEVKILDSSTYAVLGRLVGAASPGGVGIAPNLASLYVSNFDQGTIQRYGSEPLQATLFHTLLNTVPVGPNPRAISVQPGNEDVLIACTGNNTVSVVDVMTQQERISLAVGLGPKDIFVTNRFICQGCTLAYMAFITNQFDDSVSQYESDSLSPQVQNGPDGRVIATLTGYAGPTYGCWNRHSTIGFAPAHMGAFIVNSSGTSVVQVGTINFGLDPQPGFQGPAGFRTMQVVGTYATPTITGAPGDATVDNMSSLELNTISDSKAMADVGQGTVPSVLIVTYPAAGQVGAYDIATSSFYGSVPAPGIALYSYYDQ